jgi:uncharacterized protein YndB with AHSA1/START domain
MTSSTLSNEITLTRVYDAPAKMVWDAWTDPAQVSQWWGPRGFTLTTHSKDVRPGGRWVYTMHGPDGTDYPNIALYHEVEPYSRLVYDHGATENTPPLFRVTVFFAEENGKTTMDMTMTLPSPEAAEETRQFIKKAGGNSTWDRLSEFLEKETADKDVFVINRSFAAPIETMFDMWTNPEHLMAWLPPTGTTGKFIRADIRSGGSTVFKMSDGKSLTMYGRAQYLEIRRPDRIVYTQQFVDEHENISRHPFAPLWPETMLTTVTLTEEGSEQTRVTVRWEAFGKYTSEELAVFLDARSGMTQGWTGSFDKLEALLTPSPAANR